MIKLPKKQWEEPGDDPPYSDLGQWMDRMKINWIIEALELIAGELNERGIRCSKKDIAALTVEED